MVDTPDEQSIVTYVAQFLEHFPEVDPVSVSLICNLGSIGTVGHYQGQTKPGLSVLSSCHVFVLKAPCVVEMSPRSGGALALYVAKVGSIPSTPYGSLSTNRSDS